MKKNYLAIAVATLAFTLTACDSKSESQKTAEAPVAQSAAADSTVKENVTTPANSPTPTSAPATANSEANMQDISYLLGYNFGKNIEPTGIKGFETDQIVAGLNDALAGKNPRLTEEQMKQTIASLQSMVKKGEIERAKAYEAKGKAFLEANAKRDGVITTKSGLQYEVVKKGTGAKPTKDDVVNVNYEGKLVDGNVFDSSIKRGKPVEFAVGSVIPGWIEALELMQVGEKVKLYIPSELAYGSEGFPPVIPPNSVLIFDLELLSIKNPDPKATTSKAVGKSTVNSKDEAKTSADKK